MKTQSSYGNRVARTVQEFDHPDSPALAVALLAVNTYLWVRFLSTMGFTLNNAPFSGMSADVGLSTRYASSGMLTRGC